MRAMQPTIMLLMALLIALAVGCGVSKRQINTYEGCMSRCDNELEHCIRGCYTPARMWSDTKTLRCVDECNQRKAECGQLCPKLEGTTSEPVSKN